MQPSIAEVTALLTQPGAMFEIEERVIRGIPTRTWKNAAPSLQAVLTMSREHGDKPFLVYEDERTSFEQHFRQCARLARCMVDDHPDVIDAAVVGIPHKVLGEEVAAVVQVRRGSRVTQEDLQRHVALHLATFKVPVRIDLRAEPLPRNPNGKILKAVLKKEMMG